MGELRKPNYLKFKLPKRIIFLQNFHNFDHFLPKLCRSDNKKLPMFSIVYKKNKHCIKKIQNTKAQIFFNFFFGLLLGLKKFITMISDLENYQILLKWFYNKYKLASLVKRSNENFKTIV